MLVCGFDHAENRSPLLSQADSALRKLRLQPARHFRSGKRHRKRGCSLCVQKTGWEGYVFGGALNSQQTNRARAARVRLPEENLRQGSQLVAITLRRIFSAELDRSPPAPAHLEVYF